MSESDQTWLALQVVDKAPDAIIVADKEGLIRLWNAGATRIFQYSAEEAMGRSLDLIIPENLRQRHWDAYKVSMETETTKYGDEDLLAVPAIRKDGSRVSIEFTIAILRDRQGNLIGPAAVIRDVTKKWNETNEMRKRLAALEAARV